jgi:polyphosphate kinase
MSEGEERIKNRELSWLSFNERVLQEAADKTVPLIERIKFLGIYSSNMDEFFRIRVASLKKIARFNRKTRVLGFNPSEILEKIHDKVLELQASFDKIYQSILRELARHNIYLVDETELSPSQGQYVKAYFKSKVLPSLVPVMLDKIGTFPYLRDKRPYLAVRFSRRGTRATKHRYALIEIPPGVPRFVVLPDLQRKYVILLEDIIRYCLDDIFYIFTYDEISAWTVKLTRDAELDIDHDISGSFIEKVTQSLKLRKKGIPVRFSFDVELPDTFLNIFVTRMHLDKNDLIAGGRYHNFKDFMSFPNVGGDQFVYEPHQSLPHKYLRHKTSIIRVIQKKDCILHLPYQSFDFVIQFLRESAIDPKVQSIKITLYRVAQNSNIVKALIDAARNGKSVTVCLELQARFDEEANIYWSKKLADEGVKVIHGIPGMKIHSKMCLVSRLEKGKIVRYANVGTGNYHEGTARTYCDHSLFTADPRITEELSMVFDYIESRRKPREFMHLLVSPFNTRKKLYKLIQNEIKEAKAGRPASITIKVNHIVDPGIISWIYKAGEAGVSIRLIVRSTCSVIPGVESFSENITGISIVDKYLEHARVYIFHNRGNTLCYLSSADLMQRNLDHRIEVAFPVYSGEILEEIMRIIDIQLKDNTKARILNGDEDNHYKRDKSKVKIRTHVDVYNFLKEEAN